MEAVIDSIHPKNNETFKVLVVGPFSSGKSSLINALLGYDLLSTGDLPETAAFTKVVYGDELRITLYPIEDANNAIPIFLTNPSELRNYCSINNTDGVSIEEKYKVVIEHNLPLLKKGIELIDSVGIYDAALDSNVMYHYLETADVIIYTMNGTQVYTNRDKQNLDRINYYGIRNIIIVITCMGHVQHILRKHPGEMEAFCKTLRDKACQHTDLGEYGVYFVDSLDALSAKEIEDREVLSRCGITKLEQCIMQLYKNKKELKQKMLKELLNKLKGLGKTDASKVSTQKPTPRVVENMPKVLSTLKDVVENLEDEQREDWLRRLTASQKRLSDNKLNLAVIGEFSCGKSTFINALFGEDILATKFQPTTAVPTYITWDNSLDGNVKYAITIYDHHGKSYKMWDKAQNVAFSKLANKTFPEESTAMIDAVTTDNSLTNLISKVEISAPTRQFFEKIRLIDTPGVNPGMEGTAEHVHKTQEVLHNAADAAIIMFPHDQVYTASFNQFLTENASHLIKNSEFVITMCDKAKSESGLKELCDFVAKNLKSIGVKDPVIHCISANSALDAYYAYSKGEAVEEKDALWKDRFEQSIQTIFENMSLKRSSIVHGNASDLANQVTTHLTSQLQEKRQHIDAMSRALEDVSPRKMNSECNRICAKYTKKIASIVSDNQNSVNSTVKNAIAFTKSRIAERINSADDKDEVKTIGEAVKRNIPEMLKSELTSSLNLLHSNLNDALNAYKLELESCYMRYHLNVSTNAITNALSVGGTEIEIPAVSSCSIPSTLGGTVEDYIDTVFDSDSVLEGLFYGVVMLPFLVFEGLYKLFQSLESAKNDTKNNLYSAVDKCETALQDCLTNAITTIGKQYTETTDQMPDALKEHFQEEFKTVSEAYEREKASNNQQIQIIEDQLAKLKTVSESLGE